MNKKSLSERDICTKFITPAIIDAKWDVMSEVREEVSFTKGRVLVRGKRSTRGDPKRADYILSHKPGIPLAIIEAKDNHHSVGAGNLDIDPGTTIGDPDKLLAEYQQLVAAVNETREKLKRELENALTR